MISSAFLIMGTNQMLFDALTVAVSNKDLEEFSDTSAHNKAEKFCLNSIFLHKFSAFTAFCTILCLGRFV